MELLAFSLELLELTAPTYSFLLQRVALPCIMSCAFNKKMNPSLAALLRVTVINYRVNVKTPTPSRHSDGPIVRGGEMPARGPSGALAWIRPPVSRKLQHGATTSVERSSTIQGGHPQTVSAQHRLKPLQMAPDFRHPSMHPLFFKPVLPQPCFDSLFVYLQPISRSTTPPNPLN
ncbi:hypothetical protein M441DRAFT_218804 [Trichoderma asperellum CBS 433.97]|uniref:Uncharacterized protein n=1 Tax=Trichoderma asperellum (strain ATCC 204424 / CBS 433.97 / NBRC 101777) TaxID=1042311 RepID=A0A2T3ZNZ1_TRIA4|nr:hypothetical protein M441DRAFT_218804 [Trichoderma asperellum CBS 433.97]PTB46520.1 hypothetical protein M441DRAFT_218804 [Trichoderma asperellum CBS 433.97]